MNIPLCNRCPKPAFLRDNERTVLCAECWNITWGIVTDRLKADFENSIPSVGDTMDGNATVAAESNPRACAAAVANPFDDGIPEFIKRDENNIAPFARVG